MKKIFTVLEVTTWASLSLAGKTSVDLGITAIHAPLRHTVFFRNDGSEPVQIKRVVSSCPCLRVLSYPAAVGAGASAAIAVELVPDQTGRLEYSLMVLAASGESQMFALSAEVQPSADAPSVAFAELPPRAVTARERGLYQTAATIRAAESAPFFVDVRSAEVFEQCHVPLALNLPGPAVSTRGWLKSRPLVLVGWRLGRSGVGGEILSSVQDNSFLPMALGK